MNIFKAIFCMIYLRLSCGIRMTLPALPRYYGQKIEPHYTTYRYQRTSVYLCAQICASFSSCQYFNFNLEQMSCELKYRGSPVAASKSEFYVKASDISKEYAGSCANHSCTHDEVCFRKSRDSYDCLPLHINCRKPSNVANARMVGEGTLLYNNTVITCNDGAVPLSLGCHSSPCTNVAPTWPIVTGRYCTPESRWTKPTITCKRCFNNPHEMWTQISTTLTGRTCIPWINSDKYKTATFYQSTALNAENFCRSPKTGTSDDRPYLWCQTNDPSMPVDICPIPPCYGTDVGSFDSQIPGLPTNMYKFTQNFADAPVTHFTCTSKNSTLSFDNCPVSRYEKGQWTSAHLSCSDQECFESGKNYTGKMTCTVSGRTCQVWNSTTPHKHAYVLSDPEEYNSNYCRHPDGTDKVPWCFTTDPLVRYEHCWIPVC